MEGYNGNRSTQHHVRSAGRPHSAGDSLTSFDRRGVGYRAGKTVQPEPSRHLQAPESAAAGGAGQADPEGTVAAMPAGRRPVEGGGRLGGRVPTGFGLEPRATRRTPGHRTKRGK